MFALVDCNNFFVSCERVFQPRLMGRPVVVLSNNDGCIISRSEEAKALGIPMGAPLFKVKDEIKRHGVQVLSSNYELYGDMSARVMRVLEEAVPDMELYSIDEAFLNLSGIPLAGLEAFGRELRQKVLRWTGVPVSIGIAPSKTLAKVGARLGKKEVPGGVCALVDETSRKQALLRTEVEDIWGVGRKTAFKLRQLGIGTAWELASAPTALIRKRFFVTGQRIQWELQGVACGKIEVEECKKQIIASRSFGQLVTTKETLREAVATYVARAARKLRKEASLARHIGVFIRTSKRPGGYEYYNSRMMALPRPTQLTPELTRAAYTALDDIFIPGLKYYKAGVILFDLLPAAHRQDVLFAPALSSKEAGLMAQIDALNSRYGDRAVFYGASGMGQEWRGKSARRSPRFTTFWAEIPIVS